MVHARHITAGILLLLTTVAVVPAPTAGPPSQGAVPFTLPPGFVAEKVAGPPLVRHPVMAGFDERGRLFVADNGGTNQKGPELLKHLPSVIRVLEDTDGDGRFDTSKVFADKMAFPMGAPWHKGAFYTLAAPSLWKLEDTDGDGVADKRTELVTKFGFTGNAADVHGPFLGPEGRLWWTDGRHGHEIKQPDGSVLKGKAARIFRCKPDGTEVERICGGGFDDPVEMAFTDEGEPFTTVNILESRPSRVDAIIYCIDGGAWPYYEPVMHEFKRTGDLLPPMVNLGWVAPSGLMRYRSTAFGKDYEGNLFSTQFNTHKVVRHVLTRDGAGFKATTEDFLVSTDPDFHPTSVREDADGSLLVIDTGGWFRIGCPTSQIAKPQVLGAIWRIRKKDAPMVDDPRGLKLKWDKATVPELLPRLADARRFAVRDRTREQLGELGTAAVADLGQLLDVAVPAAVKREAIWALTRIDTGEAQTAIRRALAAPELTVRLSAVRSVGLVRNGNASEKLRELVVNDASAAVRREAAIALGRLKDADAVPALFTTLSAGGDRYLEHALVHALIEINNREKTLAGLHSSKPTLRRGALIALDQMDAGNLTPDLVKPLLDSDDAELQKAAWQVVGRRPAWAADVIAWLRHALATDLSEARRELLKNALVQFSKDAAVQALIAVVVKDPKAPVASRMLAVEVMALAPVDKLPPPWIESLRFALAAPDEKLVRQAVTTVRGRSVTACDEELKNLGANAKREADGRVQALAAVGPRLGSLGDDLFAFLRGRLNADLPPLERLVAAEALARAPLNDPQLEAVVQLLPEAGALELPHLVSAFEHSKNPTIARKLLDALTHCKSLPGLSPDRLKMALANYPDDVRRSADSVFKLLAVDVEKQKARLAELDALLGKGDAARGKAVFFGTRAVCAACHKCQGAGGEIGPDLTKIASIRTGRDLLEAIVFPSASIVRGFEPFALTTKDGRVVSGLIRRETADALYLVNADRAEVRVGRSAIESIEPGRVSLMPQGIDGQLAPQELADLLAYLQSLK